MLERFETRAKGAGTPLRAPVWPSRTSRVIQVTFALLDVAVFSQLKSKMFYQPRWPQREVVSSEMTLALSRCAKTSLQDHLVARRESVTRRASASSRSQRAFRLHEDVPNDTNTLTSSGGNFFSGEAFVVDELNRSPLPRLQCSEYLVDEDRTFCNRVVALRSSISTLNVIGGFERISIENLSAVCKRRRLNVLW